MAGFGIWAAIDDYQIRHDLAVLAAGTINKEAAAEIRGALRDEVVREGNSGSFSPLALTDPLGSMLAMAELGILPAHAPVRKVPSERPNYALMAAIAGGVWFAGWGLRRGLVKVDREVRALDIPPSTWGRAWGSLFTAIAVTFFLMHMGVPAIWAAVIGFFLGSAVYNSD